MLVDKEATMSEMAFLACHTCKVDVGLAKVYRDDDGAVIAIVGLNRFDDIHSQIDTRALWRFLAEHVGHHLELIREFSAAYEDVLGSVDVAGENVYSNEGSVVYSDGWPRWDVGGLPRPDWIGPPVPPVGPPIDPIDRLADAAFLACRTCRVAMDLGLVVSDDDRVVAIIGLYRFDDFQSQVNTRAAWRFLTDHIGHHLELSVADDDVKTTFASVNAGEYADGWPPWDFAGLKGPQ
jgi:hypothetical protein